MIRPSSPPLDSLAILKSADQHICSCQEPQPMDQVDTVLLRAENSIPWINFHSRKQYNARKCNKERQHERYRGYINLRNMVTGARDNCPTKAWPTRNPLHVFTVLTHDNHISRLGLDPWSSYSNPRYLDEFGYTLSLPITDSTKRNIHQSNLSKL